MSRKLQTEQTNEILNTKFKLTVEDAKSEFQNILNGLEIRVDEEAPDWIFFFCGSERYMSLNKLNGFLVCSNKHIWSNFENDYGMKCEEIKSLIKIMAEAFFEVKPITPLISCETYDDLPF